MWLIIGHIYIYTEKHIYITLAVNFVSYFWSCFLKFDGSKWRKHDCDYCHFLFSSLYHWCHEPIRYMCAKSMKMNTARVDLVAALHWLNANQHGYSVKT